MTINLISARLSKYIYFIQSWTILFANKKIEKKTSKSKQIEKRTNMSEGGA